MTRFPVYDAPANEIDPREDGPIGHATTQRGALRIVNRYLRKATGDVSLVAEMDLDDAKAPRIPNAWFVTRWANEEAE